MAGTIHLSPLAYNSHCMEASTAGSPVQHIKCKWGCWRGGAASAHMPVQRGWEPCHTLCQSIGQVVASRPPAVRGAHLTPGALPVRAAAGQDGARGQSHQRHQPWLACWSAIIWALCWDDGQGCGLTKEAQLASRLQRWRDRRPRGMRWQRSDIYYHLEVFPQSQPHPRSSLLSQPCKNDTFNSPHQRPFRGRQAKLSRSIL